MDNWGLAEGPNVRGPKPKPTALKKLAGNPGKRALPKDEPVFTGLAVRPNWLTVAARRVWEDLAPVSEKVGLLTDGDAEAFGMLCTLASEFRANAAEMSANRISRLDALMQRFGMDPGSRTRISVKKVDKTDDEKRFFA